MFHRYLVLADCVLLLHLVFVLWVMCGILTTRHRPVLRWLHISCLVWAYVALPLTLLENWLELNANVQTYVRYISAPLPRQACLSGRFSDAAWGRRRNLLFLESCGLHGSLGFHVCS